jgi:TatA/E family protein of Tat protein translocase
MGLHGISIVSLLIIFLIAVLLFGRERLRAMLEDLSAAIKKCKKELHAQQDTSLAEETKLERFDGDSS